MSKVLSPNSRTPPWLNFTNGQMELLKWIGVVSMFIDHFGRHLFGWGLETIVFGAGRLAFPFFSLVLVCNLARPGDQAARAKRIAFRLAFACVVATPAAIWARGEPTNVNIFGTLGLGVALCWIFVSHSNFAWRIFLCGLIVVAGSYVEFGLIGVSFVAAIFLWRFKRRRETAVLAFLMLLALAYVNTSFGWIYGLVGTLAALPLAWAITYVPVVMPRMPWLFYAIYPAHLALIGALKAFNVSLT